MKEKVFRKLNNEQVWPKSILFQNCSYLFSKRIMDPCEGIMSKSELKVQNTIQQRSLLNKIIEISSGF